MKTAAAFTIVTPWYGHFAGGAEVAARSFAEQLAARGFDVEVLTTCCKAPFESWWKDTLPAGATQLHGVTVRRFPVNTAGEANLHRLNARIIAGETLDEASQREYLRSTINSDGLVDYARANTNGRMVISIPYTQGLVYEVTRALAGRASVMPCLHDEPQLTWTTTKEMLQDSHRVLYLTEEEKLLAVRHYGHLIGRRLVESPVVGVGVELSRTIQTLVQDTEKTAAICREHKLPEQFFVYVGRKDVGKNVPLLIEHFREYRQAGGRADLVFLGGGDENLVPRGTGFINLGFVSEEVKYAVLSRAQGLINLSNNESFSIVVMEAWLCGVATVVSAQCDVTAAHCVLSEGGQAVQGREAFISALDALDQPETRTAMARGGRAYTRQKFNWDSVMHRFLQGAA